MIGSRRIRHCNLGIPSHRLALWAFLGCAVVAWAVQGQTISHTSRSAGEAPHASAASRSPGDWLVWGGPHHDFIAPSTGLAADWPASGPRRLWSRPLGDGYSAVA